MVLQLWGSFTSLFVTLLDSCTYMHKGQGKGGKSVFSPPPPKVWKFFPPCLEVFPPLLFSPPISIFWPFFLILPPLLEYWKKFSPPPPKAAEIFSKFSHFFKFFHKNSIFLRLPPQKKLKKFSPRKNFPPQFTVSKWFSYPHLWFHQEGFSSPLKNFNNFSPGENLSPPIRPPTCACMKQTVLDSEFFNEQVCPSTP